MDRNFVLANTKERERLSSLVERLTDEDFSLILGNGWTIAVALGHLAYWDLRVLSLIRKWKRSGVVEASPIDVEVTNNSLLPVLRALPPKAAANLAVSSAEEVDRELETTPSEFLAKIESLDYGRFYLNRSIHRKHHLDQIVEILKEV